MPFSTTTSNSPALISGMISQPDVPWTQWTGHTAVLIVSDEFSGLVIETKDSKALLLGGPWDVLKEMWSTGWKSLVAIFRGKCSAKRSLTVGAISRPPGTANDPF